MGARVEAEATRVLDAAPEDVWTQIADGARVATWWPAAERAEDVRGGRFTLVLRSSRGVPVRTDWRVAASRRPERQRWEQELAGTPFAGTLRRSAVELRIAWAIVVLACLVTALILVVGHRTGYGAVAAAVGLSAAINLR
ncbi:SRPBCC family protein [Patulibacter sp. S7RM1-6]